MTNVSIPVSTVETNLKQQLDASEELMQIVNDLARVASDKDNKTVGPGVAVYLERIARVSQQLSSNAALSASQTLSSFSKP